jgi:hypothetical protein
VQHKDSISCSRTAHLASTKYKKITHLRQCINQARKKRTNWSTASLEMLIASQLCSQRKRKKKKESPQFFRAWMCIAVFTAADHGQMKKSVLK